MKSVFKSLMFLACLMSFHPAYSLQPMSDAELSEVTGRAGFNQQRILADFAKLKDQLLQDAADGDGRISAETFIAQTQFIFGALGINLDKVVIDGVQYSGTMTINAIGVKTTMAIPSSFKSIYIGEVRLGGGASIGSVEILGLNMHDMHVEVTFRK